ncbi:MAG: hypothetical protein LUF89_06725 [Ruminococcus sp.]|nr:hypothetical protein [Ruminococcus sp.]
MKIFGKMMALAVTEAMLLTGVSLQNWVPQMAELVAVADESEETYTYSDLTYAYLEDGTIEITDCDITETVFEVPSEIDGVTVNVYW